MIQIYADGALTYDSRLEEYDLQGLRVTNGLNKGGTAEIMMPPGHPAANKYRGYKTVVEIYRDGVLRFRGRALYPIDDINNARTVMCEGELCFMQDGIQRPYLYQKSPRYIFRDVVNAYNDQVDAFKRFTVGTITVTDPNGYIRLESEDAETTLATINKLLERCGGYITFTTDETGARYINWLESVDNNNGQVIEAGENLFDFQRTGANTDLATALVPYGAKNDVTGERVTIKDVNAGKDYIVDAAAAALHGIIVKTATWDDVTEPSNLLKKAQKYLNECKHYITSLTLTALDLSYIDKSVESFKVGDLIHVISRAHGLDEKFQLVDSTEDLLNPAGSFITLGKEIRSLTSLDVAGDSAGQNAIQKTAAAIKQDFEINVQKSVEKAMESDATSQKITSIIEQKAGDIKLEVSGSLGSKAQLKLSTLGGASHTTELDLSEVRRAFANDTSAVEISGGVVTFNSGTLIINSTNLQVSADGTIKATNAELTGTANTESGKYKSELSAGRLRFYYDGAEYGSLASGYMDGVELVRGLSVRLENSAKYIGFGMIDEEGDGYNLAYCINYGANIGSRTERHVFYGSAYFSERVVLGAGAGIYGTTTVYNSMTVKGHIVLDGAFSLKVKTSTDEQINCFGLSSNDNILLGSSSNDTFVYGSNVYIGNNGDGLVQIQGASAQTTSPFTFYALATFNHNTNFNANAYFNTGAKFNANAFFANGTGVVFYKAGGSTVYGMNMTTGDDLYVGTGDAPVYVFGQKLQLGLNDFPTTIHGSSVSVNTSLNVSGAVTCPNGYGLRVKDTTGTAQWVISFNSANQTSVGVSSYATYLRGTGVYLSSSGATVTSDQRKKHDIEPLPDAYEALIDNITPVRYKYKDGTSGRYHAGFIAQEVKTALEAAGLSTKDFGGFVDINGDGEDLGLIYSEFIALLLNKIQRQEQRIQALEAAH